VKKHFILRTSWLYGKHGKNFVDTIINKAKTEKVLRVVDDQIGSPTYTRDLARAIHSILNKSTDYGTYHVSGSGSTSWCDYAKEILKLAGSRTKVLPISSKELDRPAKRPKMSVLDNSKFFKFTGYKMRDWREALKEYV
jgi:dTDP-4-dehydrorhamnose reductase